MISKQFFLLVLSIIAMEIFNILVICLVFIRMFWPRIKCVGETGGIDVIDNELG